MNEQPHPLSLALAALAREVPASRTRFALVLGAGSGRNIPPLLDAGLHVDVIEEDAQRAETISTRCAENPLVRVANVPYANTGVFHASYVAALSTHALLHGSLQHIEAAISVLARAMAPDADLMLTFGSTHDPRFGMGVNIGPQTWAPAAGAEAGVAHAYYTEPELRALLQPFDIISMQETNARELVGNWAHDSGDTAAIVHWFVHAKASEF